MNEPIEPVHIEARSITRLGAESAPAALRRVTAELGSALSRLGRLEKRCAELEIAEGELEQLRHTPVTEIRKWCRIHNLDPELAPVIQAALRRFIGQASVPTEGAPTA